MIRVIKGKAPKTLLTHGKARARNHCKRYDASLPREAPRLCRGGSNSLTFKAVVHR